MTSLNNASLVADLEFDLDALRAKYRAERDKRLRSDGLDQYQKIEGDLAVYDEDPYVEPGFTRSPTKSRSPSSAAVSAACSPAPGCARPA